MKKIFLLALALVSSTQVQAQQDQKKFMNNQVVIAFDLHEVIFSFSYTKLYNSVYRFFRKNPYVVTLCNPIAGYRVYTTFQKTKTAENIYDKLTRKHYSWLSHSRSEFLNVCNSYTLDPEMKRLLQGLKKQGYRLAICSNIGHHAFEDFRREYPEIFDMFEVIVTSHPQRNYSRKPAPEFFAHLKQEVQTVVQSEARIIFIDDKKQNACAAQKSGIQGIVFKNPAQLRAELKKQGITF